MRTAYLWEYKMLPRHIFFIILLDISASATHKNITEHMVTNLRRKYAKLIVYLLLSVYIILSLSLLG